ncbi:MAG TPA: type II secretion system protein [Casimicrobiaceae bacterium]|nr:type II secretion system protein [Casimicrobiaceae bacterium]
MKRGHHAARGFSLIEVLAAFVILALVATALFQLYGGALGNAAASDEWSRAVLVAQSRLASAASTLPLVEKTERGTDDDGRIRWESKVAPWEAPDADPELARVSEGMTTRLYRVEVEVRFPGIAGRERTFSLATVKLAAKDPPR